MVGVIDGTRRPAGARTGERLNLIDEDLAELLGFALPDARNAQQRVA